MTLIYPDESIEILTQDTHQQETTRSDQVDRSYAEWLLETREITEIDLGVGSVTNTRKRMFVRSDVGSRTWNTLPVNTSAMNIVHERLNHAPMIRGWVILITEHADDHPLS